jgi:hypothetical protein
MIRPLRRRAPLFLIALLVPHVVMAEVTFERSPDDEPVLKKITIDSGQAELSMFRAVWSNTNLVTQSGQQVSVIDPFMYQCQVLVGQQEKGGYWSAHDIWDRWKVAQVQDAGRPFTDIVKIVAEPPGWGVRKEVSIAVKENQSTAYVFSRLVATEDIQLRDDNQTIYVDTSVGNKFYVDGEEIGPDEDERVDISRWIMIYYWEEYVSVGLIAMDRELQDYPNPHRFGDIAFSESETGQGASISLRKGAGALVGGESRTQQYMLMWGDGDLRSKMEETSKKALAGELNSHVFVLPAVE